MAWEKRRLRQSLDDMQMLDLRPAEPSNSGHSLVFAQTTPDTVSSSEIEQALKKSKTRGIGVQAKAKVDLNIPFEMNSSSLRPDAKAQLEQLEAALQKDSLAIYRFQIAGLFNLTARNSIRRCLCEYQ